MNYTPTEHEAMKTGRKKAKKLKPPKKKYAHYIAEIRAYVYSNEKDIEKVKKKYHVGIQR